MALVVLAVFWGSAYWGPIAMEEPRGLGAAIDIYLRVTGTAYLVMACVLQGIRVWAASAGYARYRHWLVVLLCFVVPPAIVVPFV